MQLPILTTRIEEPLYKQLKKASYEQEMSLNTIVVEAITDWLKKYKYVK